MRILLIISLVLPHLGLAAQTQRSLAYHATPSDVAPAIAHTSTAETTYRAPVFEAGAAALREQLLAGLIYPERARANALEGTVRVAFRVRTDGTVDAVRVLHSAHPLLDAEAVRVTKALRGWRPAVYGNKLLERSVAVDVKFVLP